jgi:DNA topoisomerase-3
MKLIIAEKRSVGEAIASAIGVKEKKKGYMEGLNAIVSWCVGHLVEMAPPGAYNERFIKWRWEDLPILPEQWKYMVRDHAKEQMQVLNELMNRPDVESIICATDAGREGELIFRLVYNRAGCKKPVQRLWVSSMTEDAIRKGFQQMRPAQDYDRLYAAALCRQQADWLIGINASRIYSMLYNITLNIGRVMTPTLAMVVEREKAIANFVPEPFYTVELRCSFTASTPRLKSKEEAERIAAMCQYKSAYVKKIEKKRHAEKPPKLYDLTALQRDANRIFGYSAQQTLDYAQSL